MRVESERARGHIVTSAGLVEGRHATSARTRAGAAAAGQGAATDATRATSSEARRAAGGSWCDL